MANAALSRLERLYLQVETTYGQIPNTTGTATVGNANACRFIKASFDTSVALIERPDKTGTRSMQVGVLGRQAAKFSVDMSIAPNGVAGVAPDMDPLMQGVFGQAGVATSGTATITAASNATPIVCTSTNSFANGDAIFITGVTGNTAANGAWVITGVSGSSFTLVGSAGNGVYVSGGSASRVGYKYTLTDSIVSLAQWSFRGPSTIEQRVCFGSVVTDAQFTLGADVAKATFSGEGLWTLQSDQYSVSSPAQQGGLTAFPTEPSAPTTNGGIIAGFTGKIAINGLNIGSIRTATIDAKTNSTLIKDTFGTYTPTGTEGDNRDISIAFSLYEDDSTTFSALIALAQNKTPVQIPLFLGTVPGSIFGLVLNNVQIAAPTREEQIRFIVNFPASTAHGSSLTARDELIAYFL